LIFIQIPHQQAKKGWGADLPNLVMKWVDLCVKGVLVPWHVSHAFLCLPSSLAPTTIVDPVLLLSAQSTFTLYACHPFSRRLPTHNPAVRYGSAVSLRKGVPSSVSTSTAKAPWVNIVFFARKDLPSSFRQCVSWQSITMRISIHYGQNLGM
jgi:hypothetical protein